MRCSFSSLLGLLVAMSLAAAPTQTPVLGVLQPDPARAEALAEAGVSHVVLSVSWDRFQPAPDIAASSDYVTRLREDCAVYRRAGLRIVLDLGVQYPPAWLLALPEARYRNQHGDAFVDPSPGMNIANAVFNSAIREHQASYVAALFRELGSDWFAVRLGGGWYGELNYPPAVFAGRANCHWGFDALAQGLRPGLPAGVPACPVPGWSPGESSPDHASARAFLEWYLAALQNHHDWQIAIARRHYAGPLMMLYPSWGIRPGQLEAAVAGDLSGATPAEKNGEISRGFDFARFIGGIRDPQVWVHGTWLDSNPEWSDDASADPARWSPIKHLASLARRHRLALTVSAENTGGGGEAAFRLSARRIHELDIPAFFWAFAPDLFDGRPPELADLGPAFTAPASRQ